MPMRLYECRRYKDYEETWKGAKVIFALDEKHAIEIFLKDEGKEPEEIREIMNWSGVIYDDETR
jgi:Mn-dependent DtxR family transcriptional regulator